MKKDGETGNVSSSRPVNQSLCAKNHTVSPFQTSSIGQKSSPVMQGIQDEHRAMRKEGTGGRGGRGES